MSNIAASPQVSRIRSSEDLRDSNAIVTPMAQLLVRNLEADLVRRLKARAARNGHSAEEEHRRILRDALRRKASVSFKDLLGGMPGVGEDEDFERPRDLGRQVEL